MQAIHRAAQECDVDALRLELERGVDPNLRATEWYNTTPLQCLLSMLNIGGLDGQALTVRGMQCYRLLIESGASVNARDYMGDTVLHKACRYGNAELVKLLIEAGSDVNARGRDQNTPLHLAARIGGVASARVLLRAGAAVNAENNIGETPLFGSLRAWECNSRCFRVWPILLRAGASLPADPDQFIKYLPRQYMQKVIDAGGWANYERRHLDKLAAMLTPKDDGRRRSPRRLSPLRRVPPEVLRNIAAFAFHAGNPRTRNGWATEQY